MAVIPVEVCRLLENVVVEKEAGVLAVTRMAATLIALCRRRDGSPWVSLRRSESAVATEAAVMLRLATDDSGTFMADATEVLMPALTESVT